MADRQETDRDADLKEIARALNAQSTLLAAIVKAADHIVQTYVQLTTIKEPKDDKAKEVKNENK